jgi:hypothetical protein
MSTELINRITIKKDGVYLSSHSSNDTSPFHSWKCKGLTEVYNNRGQKALDTEIIKMLYEYARTRGTHKSVLKYQLAISNPESKKIYRKYMDLIDDKHETLSEVDKKSQWNENRTKAMSEYIEYENNMREKMYLEIADLIQEIEEPKKKHCDAFELLSSVGY